MAAALAAQGIRWVAITWVNHAGAPLVKVVPLADAFDTNGAIAAAHRLARPDGDLRLRADGAALAPLEPGSGWATAATCT